MIFITMSRNILYKVLVLFIILCIAGFSIIIFAKDYSAPTENILISSEQVIKEHFKWQNEKNVSMVKETLTAHKKEVGWKLENLEYIKIINIVEEQRDIRVKWYNERAIRRGYKPENAKIYLVEYEVKFVDDLFSNYSSGKKKCPYYLVRKNNKSPWLIDDWGPITTVP